MALVLSRLTSDDLALVEPWFDDPDTQRYLGGHEWPAQMLALAESAPGTEFRGQRTLAAYRWLARVEDAPVGYVDCGVTNRWTTCGAPGHDGAPVVLSALDGPAGSIAMVVAPASRGRGIGQQMVRAMIEEPSVRDVRVFAAGVEPENLASCRCLERVGFRVRTPVPDWEGMIYYLLAR